MSGLIVEPFERDFDVEKELESTIQKLREMKIRITPQRKAILRFLISTDTHPSVEEIFQYIKSEQGKDISLATVYNNLNVLVDVGLVYEMKFSDVTSRYDYLGNGHRHIICTRCKKIGDFNFDRVEEIEEAARRQTGYLIENTKFEIYGLCPDCQKLGHIEDLTEE